MNLLRRNLLVRIRRYKLIELCTLFGGVAATWCLEMTSSIQIKDLFPFPINYVFCTQTHPVDMLHVPKSLILREIGGLRSTIIKGDHIFFFFFDFWWSISLSSLSLSLLPKESRAVPNVVFCCVEVHLGGRSVELVPMWPLAGVDGGGWEFQNIGGAVVGRDEEEDTNIVVSHSMLMKSLNLDVSKLKRTWPTYV